MFSIAASAAANATLPPPKPKPRPMVRRDSTGGSDSSNNSNIKPSRSYGSWYSSPKYPTAAPIPGVKPILKKKPDDSSHRSFTKDSSTFTTVPEDDDMSRNEPRVHFSKLNIAEFRMELGDSPYCDGPPISMGNECVNCSQISLDEFEFYKKNSTSSSSDSSSRKKGKRIALEAWERSELLLSLGYSMEEIADAAVKTHMNRLQLAQSLQNKKWDSFNSIGERLRRSLNTSPTTKKKK